MPFQPRRVPDAVGGMIATLRLVIFDCDGVLVDSEPASHRVLVAEANRLGWDVTPEQARRFVGLRWTDLRPMFEQATGQDVGASWPLRMQSLVIEAMRDNVRAIEGAAEALRATAALGLPYRIASNSSPEEMAIKFAATGLSALVSGRVHSAKDVGVGKPAPDLFLAAAAAEGVPPGACLVLEDSRPGVTAALAAGMRCVAYLPDGDPNNLVALGATKLPSLHDFGALLRVLLLARVA
jgi:HAD superfamily hydrolase (TIGR01509 family)